MNADSENPRPQTTADALIEATPALSIRLFGSFDATINGNPLPRLRSRKGQWLLALLALRGGRPVERAWLAGVLWPETTEENALVSLRQTLSDLRRALGPEAARITAPTVKTLCLDVSDVFVDVLEAEAALNRGDPASLQRAVALHQKPFLEDCLEEWALTEREARQQTCLQALQALAAEALTRGAFVEATAYLRRIAVADPYNENAQRGLMSALAASGDWGGAMLAYRALRLLLHHELKAEPAAQTQALYRRLRSEAKSRGENPETPPPPRDMVERPGFSPAGDLPRPLTELVGRQQEIATVTALLHKSCLVTLMGPGGVGKTRLAICAGEEWAEDATNGVWFVDLAPLTDAALVPQSVADVLGAQDEPGRAVIDTLVRVLRDRNLLLILDNCEHVLDACAELAARLLRECGSLRLLTTSRHALRVTGETVFAVPSLSVPDEGATIGKAAISESDAVRLFVERAASVSPGFVLTEGNAPFIAQICRRLDGIPLAIELAAARVRMLAPDQIAARLDDRFRLLTHGNRAALPRQQTLRAALDWSYDLLTEPERLLFARLSVFAGGWTLEDAEEVCASDDGAVFDTLTALEEKSLVSAEAGDGTERRYRLLETARQYARERLDESGGTGDAILRHRSWTLALVEAAFPHGRGPETGFWLNRLEAEHDNLRAALDHCDGDEDSTVAALCLAASLWRFWMDRGHYREGLARLTHALERAGENASMETRTLALNGAAALAWHQGDLPAARRASEEALRLARHSSQATRLDSCLHNLGNVYYSEGRYAEARALWQESLDIRRATGDRSGITASLNNLGICAYNEGDYAQARELHTEALALSRDLRNDHSQEASLMGLGCVALAEGEETAAESYYEQGRALAQDLGDKDSQCDCLIGLARAALVANRFARAGEMLKTCLIMARDAGLTPRILDAMDSLTDLALSDGAPQPASLMSGMCEELREELAIPRLPEDQARFLERSLRIRKRLGNDAFLAAREQGRSFSQEQAILFALEISMGCPP